MLSGVNKVDMNTAGHKCPTFTFMLTAMVNANRL